MRACFPSLTSSGDTAARAAFEARSDAGFVVLARRKSSLATSAAVAAGETTANPLMKLK